MSCNARRGPNDLNQTNFLAHLEDEEAGIRVFVRAREEPRPLPVPLFMLLVLVST